MLALVVVACAADAVLFLQRAGTYLTGLKLVAIAVLGLTAAGLIAVWPRAWLFAVPFLGFVLFRGVVVHLIRVPEDAVFRDAQAGLAAFVVASAQLLLVAFALALASSLRGRLAARSKR